MITRSQANRLRGLVQTYGNATAALAVEGSGNMQDWQYAKESEDLAREKLLAYIHKLTGPAETAQPWNRR